MKNKKFLTGLFVLLMILCLGIGYAAITDKLDFTGKVTTANDAELSENFIVKFESASVIGKSADIDVADIDIKDGLKVEFNVVGMSAANSFVTFELVIVNESADLYADGAAFEVYNYASDAIVADDPETTDVDETTPKMGTNSAGQYITPIGYQTNPFYTITITKTSEGLGQIAPKNDPDYTKYGTQTYEVKIEMTAVPQTQRTDNFTIKFIYTACSSKSTS